ncbi:lipopolysaccharide biosynthesis protein [Halodesulfovibrio aestuarii]|uniref:Lipopolysaccharide biosynthesis protein n=1 Tax=Halodesulfovibrio aestuarii TaxID=126333 RepID=A0ABV4JWE5_9BACT
MLHSVLHTVKKILFSNLLASFLLFLLSIVFSRKFGVAGRGTYALMVTIPSVLTVFCSLGLINSLIYHIKKEKLQLSTSLCYLSGLTAWLVFVLYLLKMTIDSGLPIAWFADLLALRRFSHNLEWGVVFLLVISAPCKLFLMSYFQAVRDIKKFFVLITLIPLLQLVLLVLWPTEIDLSLQWYLLVYAIIEVVFSVSYAGCLYWKSDKYEPYSFASKKDVFLYSIKGYLGTISGTVNKGVDVLLVDNFVGTTELGLYSNAKSIVRIFQVISNSVGSGLVGFYLEKKQDQLKKFHKSISSYLSVCYLLLTLVAYFVAHPLIYYVYGIKFIDAVGYIPYLLVSMYFTVSSVPEVYVLNSCNKPQVTSYISLVGLLIVFGGGIVGGNYLGMQGILYAFCLSAMIIYCLRKYCAHKLLKRF